MVRANILTVTFPVTFPPTSYLDIYQFSRLVPHGAGAYLKNTCRFQLCDRPISKCRLIDESRRHFLRVNPRKFATSVNGMTLIS